jgi:sugar lactone lactonase YvrE
MTLSKALPVASLALSLTLLAGVTLTACGSSSPSRPVTGTAGTGAAGTTTAGGAGTTAAGTAGATGNAGTNASGGAGTGAAGTVATGTAGTGAAGTLTTGTAGTDAGAAGTNADGGITTDGGTAYHRFVCPATPTGGWPAQTMTNSKNICTNAGFKFNYNYNEGPTWIATQNAFFFSNFVHSNPGGNAGGDIIKVDLEGNCEVWLHDVACNGLGVSSTGKLLGACHGPRAVMEYDPATKAGRIVASMANGKMFDAPNDLISTSNGNIYFSNTTYELGGRPLGLDSALVRIDPTGATSVIQAGGLNGMALSPDERTLYVVGMGVWMLNADGSPGAKTNQGGPGGDGIAMDCAGRITSTGTNSAYGGPDGKLLIAVGGNTDARFLQTTVPGFP